MSDYGRLAYTGLPAAAVFGVSVDQWWIGVTAVVLIAAGVGALRLGWRRSRSAHSR